MQNDDMAGIEYCPYPLFVFTFPIIHITRSPLSPLLPLPIIPVPRSPPPNYPAPRAKLSRPLSVPHYSRSPLFTVPPLTHYSPLFPLLTIPITPPYPLFSPHQWTTRYEILSAFYLRDQGILLRTFEAEPSCDFVE